MILVRSVTCLRYSELGIWVDWKLLYFVIRRKKLLIEKKTPNSRCGRRQSFCWQAACQLWRSCSASLLVNATYKRLVRKMGGGPPCRRTDLTLVEIILSLVFRESCHESHIAMHTLLSVFLFISLCVADIKRTSAARPKSLSCSVRVYGIPVLSFFSMSRVIKSITSKYRSGDNKYPCPSPVNYEELENRELPFASSVVFSFLNSI